MGTSVLGCRDATCCNQNQKGTQCFFPSASLRACTLSLPPEQFFKVFVKQRRMLQFQIF